MKKTFGFIARCIVLLLLGLVILSVSLFLKPKGLNANDKQAADNGKVVVVTMANFVPEVILSKQVTMVEVVYKLGIGSKIMIPVYDQLAADYPDAKFVRIYADDTANAELMKTMSIPFDLQPTLIVFNPSWGLKPAEIAGVYTKEHLEVYFLPLAFAQVVNKAIVPITNAKGAAPEKTPAPTPDKSADSNKTAPPVDPKQTTDGSAAKQNP